MKFPKRKNYNFFLLSILRHKTFILPNNIKETEINNWATRDEQKECMKVDHLHCFSDKSIEMRKAVIQTGTNSSSGF